MHWPSLTPALFRCGTAFPVDASSTSAVVVPITTEAAMRDAHGMPIRDCLMPHIAQFNGTWYAYGFGQPRNASGDQRFATCYTSTTLAAWTKAECSTPGVGAGESRCSGPLVQTLS